MENIVYNFAKITFTPHPSSSCNNFDWGISKPVAMSDTEEEAGESIPPSPVTVAAATLQSIVDTSESSDSCSNNGGDDDNNDADADVSDAHSSSSYPLATSSPSTGSRGGVSRRRMPTRIAKDNFNRICSAIMKPSKKKQRRELSTNAQTLKTIEKIYLNQHMKKFTPTNLETIFEEPSDENAADAEDDSEEQGSSSISQQVRVVKFGSRKLRRAISFSEGLNKSKYLSKKRRLKVKKTFGKRLVLKKITMTEFHDRLNKSFDSAMVDEEDEDDQDSQSLANHSIKSTMDDMQLPAISMPGSSSRF